MSHPSMRFRLMLGTGLVVSGVLMVSLFLIYQSVARMLWKEVRIQLIESAALLSKSSELEPQGVVYEWHEALESGSQTGLSGIFQFWDQKSGATVASPALADTSLDPFHGTLNETVIRPITLPDGRQAMAAGLLHLPFLDDEGLAEMKKSGNVLKPQDLPQILVCARETSSISERLTRMKWHLIRTGTATLIAIWCAIWVVSHRTLRPINALAQRLDERSRQNQGPIPSVPSDLPLELTDLANAFNRTLERVEAARERERRFALHAAHELRTPIAGIRATLEQAVSRERDAPDLRRRALAALTVANDMGMTIHTLMRLARLRGGIEGRTLDDFDAASSIVSMFQEHAGEIALQGLTLCRQEPDQKVVIKSDPDLFRLIVTILIDNSVKHSPQGSEIKYQVLSITDHFIFRISNPAPDLSEDELPGIIQPFQRGRYLAAAQGAGLGLSLATEAIELLGGKLRLEILPTKWLQVEMTLPLEALNG